MAGGLFALTDWATNYFIGKKYRRQQYQLQEQQHQRQIDNAQRAIDQFAQDKSYNKAVMGQSLAARGLSFSTIAQQKTSDFDANSSRREAAQQQNLDLANKGLQVLHSYHHYQNAMTSYNAIRALAETVVSAYSGMTTGGFGSTGTEDSGNSAVTDPAANQFSSTNDQGWVNTPGDNLEFSSTNPGGYTGNGFAENSSGFSDNYGGGYDGGGGDQD